MNYFLLIQLLSASLFSVSYAKSPESDGIENFQIEFCATVEKSSPIHSICIGSTPSARPLLEVEFQDLESRRRGLAYFALDAASLPGPDTEGFVSLAPEPLSSEVRAALLELAYAGQQPDGGFLLHGSFQLKLSGKFEKIFLASAEEPLILNPIDPPGNAAELVP